MLYNISKAAERLGIAQSTLWERIHGAHGRPGDWHNAPGIVWLGKQAKVDEPFFEYAAACPQRKRGETHTLEPISVIGLKPSDRIPDALTVWDKAEQLHKSTTRRSEKRACQEIIIPDNKPVVLVNESDWHIGSTGVNYPALRKHIELIRDCPYCYCILYGDLHENSITPKVQHLAWNEQLSEHEQISLLMWCLEELSKSRRLLAGVGGNHDERTYLVCGLDILAIMLRDTEMLFDPHEIFFDLRVGDGVNRFGVRHSWKGRSVTNITYGIEKYVKDFGDCFDVGIGGHFHNCSVAREFVYGDKVKYAVQLASYKEDDSYPRKLGLHDAPKGHLGSYSFIVYPNGELQGFRDAATAVRVCAMERGE